MNVVSASVSVYHVWFMASTHKDQKKASDPLGLGLYMVMSLYVVGAGILKWEEQPVFLTDAPSFQAPKTNCIFCFMKMHVKVL